MLFLPDFIEGSEERNQIRDKIRQCFDGVSVHGLPYLRDIPEGEGVDYPYLSERFQQGLAAISNTIVEKLPVPKYNN